jgi:hypothetical protein
MGRPAGVGNAGNALKPVASDGIGQGRNLTHFAGPVDVLFAVNYGHAGGVVAPIFQTAQAFEKNSLNIPF